MLPEWSPLTFVIKFLFDNLPLSGGLFNREDYLEGLKRRSEGLHPSLAGKMNCNIQWSCLFIIYNDNCKPVCGIWDVKIRPGKDNVSLSGELFNKAVYLEGLKRRSKVLHSPYRLEK